MSILSRISASLSLVAACLLLPAQGQATPRHALTAGSPCSTCHVLPQGGGARNDIGWGSEHWAGLVAWEKMGLASLDDAEEPGFVDGRVLLGGDSRLQVARLGAPVADPAADPKDATFEGRVPGKAPDYMAIPMQLQPYLTVLPVDWLQLTGSYNLAWHGARYPGSVAWEAAAIVKGKGWTPTLHVGRLQPSIGVRHDDHTMLLRADAATPRTPIIPPNYSELGAELHWQPKSWLQVNAGGYANTQLQESVSTVRKDGPAWLARVSVLPQMLDWRVNTWLGASVYGSGDFMLMNAFAGAGKDKLLAVMLEASASRQAGDRETMGFMAKVDVPLATWLTLEGRVEHATSQRKDVERQTQQLVAGVRFIPMGYVMVIPEYRLIKTDEYILGQYTLQTHAFF